MDESTRAADVADEQPNSILTGEGDTEDDDGQEGGVDDQDPDGDTIQFDEQTEPGDRANADTDTAAKSSDGQAGSALSAEDGANAASDTTSIDVGMGSNPREGHGGQERSTNEGNVVDQGLDGEAALRARESAEEDDGFEGGVDDQEPDATDGDPGDSRDLGGPQDQAGQNDEPVNPGRGPSDNPNPGWKRGQIPCFPAGTPIATPQGERSIECLRVGDEVLAYDFGARAVVSRPVLSYTYGCTTCWVDIDSDAGTLRDMAASHLDRQRAGVDRGG